MIRNDPILTRRNWCEVAAGLGLRLPGFTVFQLPGQFVDWCYAIELVDELRQRNLVGTFVEKARSRADQLAKAAAC